MILRIDHLGIAVNSLAERLPFWTEALGLVLAGREHVATEGVDVAFLSAGQSRIELLEPARADSAIARHLERRGEGLHHVTFAVGDLDGILSRLTARRIPMLLAGMLAPPNMGEDYARSFNAIYPTLAKKYDVLLYPFFLEGVAGTADLNQRDGLHPTPAGVDRIVQAILPKAEELLAKAKAQRKP